jgi:hypothetical protein
MCIFHIKDICVKRFLSYDFIGQCLVIDKIKSLFMCTILIFILNNFTLGFSNLTI